MANRSDVDVIFVGGSLIMDGKANERVRIIKELSMFLSYYFLAV